MSSFSLLPSTLSGPSPSWVRILPNGWRMGIWCVAVLAAAPLIAVVWIALQPGDDVWQHLVSTVLPRYAYTTALLALGVGLGTLVLGTSTAWLVTMCRFPGRRLLSWALLLPLAMPAYLAAYAYTELLEYAGPVQMALRAAFGWSHPRDYWFPEVRSLGGAVVFMTLVLYPYVYLLSRAAFLEQSTSVLEVGRSLGRGPWGAFFTVALPMARPTIVVGVLLAVMETLNDFGTVDFFAVPTFTVGIFRVWFGMNNAPGAAQLAGLLLAVVLVLIGLERLARRSRRFAAAQGRGKPLPGYSLARGRGLLVMSACAVPVVLGFVVPATLLGMGSLQAALAGGGAGTDGSGNSGGWPGLAGLVFNSLSVSALAAAVAVTVGLFLAYGLRVAGRPVERLASRVASVGYAVPGTILAIGVIVPAAWLDNALDGWLRYHFGVSSGLLLSGTLAAVTFAYVARFLALSFGTLEAGLGKITPSMDHAARSLGASPGATLWRVHAPLLRGSVLTAALLVFVDGMKELPMTLILRPFNFDTLATHVYEYASYEQFAQATPAALAIVLVGLLPVIGLSRTIAGARKPRPEETPWVSP